jgi:hypothetical protein
MASIMHTVADGIRATLAGGTFTKTFTPQVSYDAEALLENLATLRVDVVPMGSVFAPISRTSSSYQFMCDVAVRKKFAATDADTDGTVKDAEVAALIELLEDLNEYLADPARRIFSSTYLFAQWAGSEMRWLWIPEHLRQERQYTGIFRVTYRVVVE